MTTTTGLTSAALEMGAASGATDVIALERLPAERGVAVLVDGEYVALFRIDDEVLAVDHVDPFTGSPVLARGIVASVGDRVVVASPLHKQRFDLRTGACLDDGDVTIRTWPVHVVGGRILVGPTPRAGRP